MKEIDEKDLEQAGGGYNYKTAGAYGTKTTPDTPACSNFEPLMPGGVDDTMPRSSTSEASAYICGRCRFYRSTDGTCRCDLI